MNYFKVDATELRPEPAEIELIDPRRTSLMPATVSKRINPTPIQQKRNRAIRSIEIAAAVSLAINVIQAVIIYVLQAGPI